MSDSFMGSEVKMKMLF